MSGRRLMLLAMALLLVPGTALAQKKRPKREVKTEAPPPPPVQPEGDFVHTPASEQAANHAVPIYVEYNGSGRLSRVVVKYQSGSASGFTSLTLVKRGSGWAGVIPCSGVQLGTLRYYVQGFDAEGSPAALSGDPKRPYTVPIKSSITGPAPTLPGEAPPTCDETAAPEPEPDAAPAEGESETKAPPESPDSYERIWIGVSGSIDFVPLAGVQDACKLTSSAAPGTSPPYYCTNPDGSDFPSRRTTTENDGLQQGHSGNVDSAFRGGTIHATLALDYALSANALVGVRLGYIAHAYPGDAAAKDGSASSIPLHAELRGGFLFGDAPLAHAGFAPYAFLAAGYAEVAASSNIQVVRDGIAGQWPVNAWRTSGPWFVGIGAGARYAFSKRVAFLGSLRANASFGGATLLSVAPEAALQYGF